MTDTRELVDDWPSHHEELTRKTLDQLKKWADRYEERVISVQTWVALLMTLYDTTSGMIDNGVSNLISNMHREAMQEVYIQAL